VAPKVAEQWFKTGLRTRQNVGASVYFPHKTKEKTSDPGLHIAS